MKLRNIALSLSALVLLSLPTVNAKEEKAEKLTGWQTVNGQQYFYNEDGTKATSSWIDHFYVNKEGKKVVSEFIYDENYKASFFLKADGTFAENQWLEINGKWYYFKAGGYMAKNQWKDRYYLKDNGQMAINEWVYTPEAFYVKADGSYAENQWLEIGTKWYYFKESGFMAKNEWKGNYYLNPNGAMAKQEWIYDDQYKSYFYAKKDGKYAEKEWIQDGGKWYYLLSGGYLATRQWIGDYFVNGSGAMMTKEWLFDPSYQSMFYLNADGRYARNEWVQIDGDWYYFKANGARAEREWVGNYYLGDAGAMATGVVTVGDTKYTFSNSGTIEKQEKVNRGWVQKNGQRYFYNGRSEQVGGSNAKKVIDVSEHNGKIQNWSQVIRDNGIDGVIVRLGYYAYDEDKQLAYNVKELNRLGVPYGVYLYTYAENESDAELEAKHTIKLMEKYHIQPSYPIYYDVENWEYVNKTKAAPKDTKTWVKIVNKYMDTMHKAGYTNVRIYSYRHLLQTRLNHPDILKYVDWVAAYTDALDWNNPHYSGSKGWQYTSSEYLKGISGKVDVSVWY